MADAPARLLVTLPETARLRREVERRLPGVGAIYTREDPEGPWPSVEAMLVGSPQREIPRLEPRLVPNLRFVQRVYTGLDAFPFAQIAPGVRVAGNVGGFAPFVAEQALALLLALANNLLPNYERLRGGRIRPVDPPRWLLGHRALLLGFGEIAHELAARLGSFGVIVDGLSRTGEADPRAVRMYPADQLLEALPTADFVVDCRPLTSATRSTIDASALARMRPDAIFVNVGRAGTVDEDAMFRHLSAHPEFRYGTDVLWREDPVRGAVEHRLPFGDLPNFLASPHIAGLGTEARARALDLALSNLERFFAGAPVLHVVDRTEYE